MTSTSVPEGRLLDGSACRHEGEAGTFCTRCWMNIYEARTNPGYLAEMRARERLAVDAQEETFVERADYEKGFAAYFQLRIAPLLVQLEQDRQQAYRQFMVALSLVSVACLFFTGLVAYLDGAGPAFAVLFTYSFLSVYWFLSPTGLFSKYSDEAKATLLPRLLEFFGDLAYHPVSHFESRRLVPFGIMPAHTSYSSSNHITGSFDQVHFDLAEILLRKSDGEHTNTAFQGIAILLQTNKPFEGKTIVVDRTSLLSEGGRDNGLVGLISAWMYEKEKFPGLEPLELEDPRFTTHFCAYSTDQVEGRYLLTPAFMERLMQLVALMSNWGKDPSTIDERSMTAPPTRGGFRCCFLDDSLLLLIPCNNLFEPGSLFKSAYQVNEIRCVLYQIYLIRKIIEVLKLDTYIEM